MDNTINNYKIGQVVGVVVVKDSNAYRRVERNNQPRVFNAVVTKIGRKYITASTNNNDYVFNCEHDFYEKTDYSADYRLFPSREDAEQFVEKEKLLGNIKYFFGYFYTPTFTLDELRQINTIIENVKIRDKFTNNNF